MPLAETEPATGKLRLGRIVAMVTAAVVIGWSAIILVRAGTPVLDVTKHAAYVLLCVVLPGTLVHKALRGPMQSWLADLSLGAATGLVLELFAWALFSALDLQSLLWVWPALSLLLFVPPTTRARILGKPTGRWSVGPTLAVGLACVEMVWSLDRTFIASYELPPSGHAYYPDLVWHMGLTSEAMRALPLMTPQSIADGPLRYHWFSHAHMAASALITGTDVPVIVLRLWFIPVAILMVLLTAVLAERVSGRTWAGGLAALLVVPTLSFPFWPVFVGPSNHVSPLSPSQLFSMPLTLLLVFALVDFVRARGRPSPGTASIALLVAVGCAGAKSSALPVVVAGLGVTFIAALFLRRNRLVVIGAGAVLSLLTLLALGFVAGGDAGSGFQLFSSFSLQGQYRTLITQTPNLKTPVLDGLVNAPGVGPILLVSLSLAILLIFIRLASVVFPFFQRRLRTDLASWLLVGTCLGALVPFLVLAHPGYSQYYFLFGAVPFGSVLWAWSLADLVGGSRKRALATGATFVAVGAATIILGLNAIHGPRPSGKEATLQAMHTFVVQVAVIGLALLGMLAIALWMRRRDNGVLIPVAVAGAITPVLVSGALSIATGADRQAEREARPVSPQLLAQGRAAQWIAANTPMDAVMATNDHCLTGSGLNCNSRQWWISGLGGRRVLIEGWGYLPRAAHKGYYDPALYDLNQAVFTDPTPERLAAIRRLGVGWLVAERNSGLSPSSRLDQLADKRYDNDTVAVYELR